MTEELELEAKKLNRKETKFIKNKEKPKVEKKSDYKPVQKKEKDSAIVIWDSKNGYNESIGEKARRLNAANNYLRNCLKPGKNHIMDIIMIWFFGLSFFGCWALSWISNIISKR